MSGIVNNIHKRFNFNEPKANHVIYELAAKFSFIICLVVAFFNTSLPFQERIRDVNDIATSNPVNQVVFSALFLSSTFSLIPLTNKLWRLIKREKFLTLFLLWCALSIIWSDFSFVSFKRFFQILTVVIVFEAILLHSSSTNTTVKFFKPILALYLILSFLSVLLVPGATDSTSGSWRGLTHTKNLLGQAALMNLIFWFNMFRFDSYKGKILSFSMTLISIILLLGSKSITAIITLIMLILLGLLVSSDRALFNRLNVGWTFSIVVLLSFGVLFLSTYFLAPDIIQALPNYF